MTAQNSLESKTLENSQDNYSDVEKIIESQNRLGFGKRALYIGIIALATILGYANNTNAAGPYSATDDKGKQTSVMTTGPSTSFTTDSKGNTTDTMRMPDGFTNYTKDGRPISQDTVMTNANAARNTDDDTSYAKQIKEYDKLIRENPKIAIDMAAERFNSGEKNVSKEIYLLILNQNDTGKIKLSRYQSFQLYAGLGEVYYQDNQKKLSLYFYRLVSNCIN